MGGLANGLAQLFKAGRKRIGNAIDNYLLDAEARKAIEDEVISKFKPQIELIERARSKRAANLTELDKNLAQSKQDFQKAQDAWNQKYATELAAAKAQRQTEISDYDTKLHGYQNVLDNAKQNKQSIIDQLYDFERGYDKNKTIFTDVKTGENYIYDPNSGGYKNLSTYRGSLGKKGKKAFDKRLQNPEYRLFDKDSGNLINPFDKQVSKTYKGQNNNFDDYLNMREGQNATLLRDADNKVNKARSDLSAWKSNHNKPQAWDDTTPGNNDLTKFKTNFQANNGNLPTTYRFNGHDYANATELDKAYQDAITNAQKRLTHANKKASDSVSKRDKEIAQRIQDAKDIKKAKLALGTGAGAGALFAGAAAMYGGDDTDNTDNINNTNNIDNTDNTYTGEPDPDLKIENTPEGKAALIGKSLVDTDFDSDKADALASAAYDQGVEDGNSARSSGDLVNNIAAATGGHTIDDELFELLKAMKDPYKADAIANYIYSRHGDDPEVQRLGWRGWLNKYYGDSLRSRMNIDPSGYKGMHISGGL